MHLYKKCGKQKMYPYIYNKTIFISLWFKFVTITDIKIMLNKRQGIKAFYTMINGLGQIEQVKVNQEISNSDQVYNEL